MIVRSIAAQNFIYPKNYNNYRNFNKANNSSIVINPSQISYTGRKIKITENNIRPKVVVELYEHGFSQEDLANMYNCNVGAIHNVLYSNGIDTRNDGIKNNEFIPKDKAKILELFNKGYSQKDIAQSLGYSTDTVHFVLISNNVDTRGR